MSKRNRVVSFAVIIIVSFSVAFGYALRVCYIPPILVYHSIVPKDQIKNSLFVSTTTFSRQMDFLKRHYNVVSLESLVSLIKEKRHIPPKTIAITFDDGRQDNYTYAFPVLENYHLPAAIFVIINEMGMKGMLSWDEIKSMRDSKLITIGSHTLTHPYLVEVNSEEELKRQIYGSKQALEGILKARVNGFCYPVGGITSKASRIVEDSGYKYALCVSPGKKFPNNNVYALKRIKITEKDSNMFSFWVKCSGYYIFVKEHLSSKKNNYGY